MGGCVGVGGWMGVVGLAENKANSAPLELGLSLAIEASKEIIVIGDSCPRWHLSFEILV